MTYISIGGPGYIRISALSGRTSPAKGGHLQREKLLRRRWYDDKVGWYWTFTRKDWK